MSGGPGRRGRTWGAVVVLVGATVLVAAPAIAVESPPQPTVADAPAPVISTEGDGTGPVALTSTPIDSGAEVVASLPPGPDHQVSGQAAPVPSADTREVPTLTWSITPETPVDDGPITMAVTVSGSASAPTGQIEVGTWDTNDYYGVFTLGQDGRTAFVFGLPAGTHRLYVGYNGDDTYRWVNNVSDYLTVKVLPRGEGEVTLDAPAELTAAVGAPTTFDVDVTGSWSLPEELDVDVDGVATTTYRVPPSGVVRVTVPGQAPGAHTIVLRTAETRDLHAASATVRLTVAAATAPTRATAQPTGEVRATTSRTAPGVPLTVTARGYQPGELVAFYLHSEPVFLGTATADADGVATLTVSLPAEAPAGEHHVRGIGGTSGVWAEVPVTLTAAVVPQSPVVAAAPVRAAELAVTGSDAFTGLATGAGMLLLGAVLLLARRRATRNGAL